MELVYLWVEKYKNIKNQGFRFSPRFECEFKDGVLTIDEKEDYVSIFPKNINVTAIVGENGSGKSSILKFILMLIFYTKYKDLIKENYDGSEEYKSYEAKEYLKHKNIKT
jgi:AAA15 family ATPase/GTPase